MRGWGVSFTPRPHLTPRKDPVAILQEAGWASGPVWRGAENLAPNGIRSPDRPARRQSLYRLSYPAAEDFIRNIIIILCINYIIIMGINDDNAVINYHYGRLQDLILLFKIPAITRKDFFQMYREFRHAHSKRFASPALYPAFILWRKRLVLGDPLTVLKRRVCEDDHSPPHRTEVKNKWSCTSTPSVYLPNLYFNFVCA
jgi:hypothetical protein